MPYNVETEEQNTIRDIAFEIKKEINIKDLKVLIVEDDETSDLLISMSIRKFCREILHTTRGLQAIEICRDNPDIDLILMDIKLPGMDGYETTGQIRQFNTKVVIIAQTAFALHGDFERAIDAGCNSHISKPINKALLLELIEKFFGPKK